MIKRSLHVGLNYPGTSAELSGCVNDAYDWQAFFTGLGYDAAVVLEPTKADMIIEIEAILGQLRFGDRFVFTYSGHGSWIPDRSGDEIDGRDEVLCPADFERNVITDDEMYVIMGHARFGVRRTILSDSCFSGTVQRVAHWSGAGVKPRFMPPSMFLSGRDQKRAERVEHMRATAPSRTGAVLVSGCDDTEFSYDAWFGNRANGAFTRTAIDRYQPGMTMRQWHRAIREVLPNGAYPQSPELQGRPWQRYFKL